MTKFHEIALYRILSYESHTVEADQLENYIGDYLVWDTRFQVSLTYSTILNVRQKGDYIIVDTYVDNIYEEGRVRHSFPKTTKVVIGFKSEVAEDNNA